MKSLDRTDGGAIGIFAVDARRGDDISHNKSFEFPPLGGQPFQEGLLKQELKTRETK